jgi:hypothetical protein
MAKQGKKERKQGPAEDAKLYAHAYAARLQKQVAEELESTRARAIRPTRKKRR